VRGRDLRRHDSARMLVELVATPVRVLAMQEVDLVIVLAPEERLQCCQRRIFGRAHIAGREHVVYDWRHPPLTVCAISYAINSQRR